MHLTYCGVNDAFEGLVRGIETEAFPLLKLPSRAGEVLMIAEPVLVTFTQPHQRVLFNPARDCNPFFHLYEAMWMLAGHNRVHEVAYYNSRMTEFSDDGAILHGAYGHRWRSAFGFDQLHEIIDELRRDPTTRRCVLQMWDATAAPGMDDLHMATTGGKDVPCNTHAYFSAVSGKLNLTVCNRSNDLIWGMLGANFVHFTFLLEYVAFSAGLRMGEYNVFTNNLHAYTARWDAEAWLKYSAKSIVPTKSGSADSDLRRNVEAEQYPSHTPGLLDDQAVFDREVAAYVSGSLPVMQREPFLYDVAVPMTRAFMYHKDREYATALRQMEHVRSQDWQAAGITWLKRRQADWERKRNQKADNNERSPYLECELRRIAAEASAKQA